MTPERWRQIDEVFNEASERITAERAPFLDNACAGDAELRTEVESLLAALRGADARLRATIDHAVHQAVEADVLLAKDRRLGPYRLLREIGEGGMGTVYLAVRDDDEYHTEVAIKLLHRGFGKAHAVARFRDERQILATLVHPGIVRLLDGGSTEDGSPYLVMECVEGQSITRYAEAHNLSIPERLVLFRHVCTAVTFAHQRLIVHRDIKPSNVLVTVDGVPKLLDFGIAKLLDPEANREARTRTGVHMFTPEYASPEQILGEPVTTSADVYSLGAVLYELCTGVSARKLEGDGIEALRAMIEAEPKRPSVVAPPERRRALMGDVDAIILKALRKEPASRYASVEQLSFDIGRYLEGMPVQARSGTFTYRAGKLLRRSRGILAVVSLIVAVSSTATVVSLGQARRAEKRFNDVRQLAKTMVFEIDEKLGDHGGATEARELIVSRALQYFDSLTGEGGDDPELSRESAAAYIKIGDIQGNLLIPNLGRPRDGLASNDKARQIIDKLVAAGHGGADTRWALARALMSKGSLHRSLHEPGKAHEASLKALDVIASLPRDKDFDYQLVMKVRINLCNNAGEDGALQEMLLHADAIRDLAMQWSQVDPSSKLARYWLGVAHEVRGRGLLMLGEPSKGAGALQESASMLTALLADNPENATFRREVWIVRLLAGVSQFGGGDTRIWVPNEGNASAAEREIQQARPLMEQEVERDPGNARAAVELVVTLDALALVTGERDPAAALPLFERAREIFTRLPATISSDGYARDYERAGQCGMAETLARLGQREKALAAIDRGLALAKEDTVSQFVSSDSRVAVWSCTYQAARARLVLGDQLEAEKMLRDVIQGLQQEVAAHPLALPPRIGLVETLQYLAKLEPVSGCENLRKASEVWRSWPGTSTEYTRRRQTELDTLSSGCPKADEKNQPRQ